MQGCRRNTPILIIAFSVIFLGEILGAHWLRPDLAFASTNLSYYATGPYGFVIATGLSLIAVNYALLTVLFLRRGVLSKWRAPSAVLLGLTSLATAGLTIFPTDTGGSATVRGTVHVVYAHLHFVLLPLSVLFLSGGLKEGRFRAYRTLCRTFFGMLIVAGLVLVCKEILGISSIAGLIQKSLIVCIVMWIILSARFHRVILKEESILSRS